MEGFTIEKAVEFNLVAGVEETKANEIFKMMQSYLEAGEGKDLPSKVGATFQFDIRAAKRGPIVGSWEIDLKSDTPACRAGKADKADAIFTMIDDDFYKVCLGKLNPQMAFMQGKMKIKGNLGKATKFTPELFPPPTEENIAKYLKGKM